MPFKFKIGLQKELKGTLDREKQTAEDVNTRWLLLSTEDWTDNFAGELLNLPLERLSGLIEQFQDLKVEQKTTQERITHLEPSQRKQSRSCLFVYLLRQFIRQTWIRFFWKSPGSQPDELQQLHRHGGDGGPGMRTLRKMRERPRLRAGHCLNRS